MTFNSISIEEDNIAATTSLLDSINAHREAVTYKFIQDCGNCQTAITDEALYDMNFLTCTDCAREILKSTVVTDNVQQTDEPDALTNKSPSIVVSKKKFDMETLCAIMLKVTQVPPHMLSLSISNIIIDFNIVPSSDALISDIHYSHRQQTDTILLAIF